MNGSGWCRLQTDCSDSAILNPPIGGLVAKLRSPAFQLQARSDGTKSLDWHDDTRRFQPLRRPASTDFFKCRRDPADLHLTRFANDDAGSG
jgi:hypothetical protein